MASSKNPAPVASTNVEQGADTSDWIDERFGYAPYWNPAAGESIVCRLIARDDTDPEFTRFLVEAMSPLTAYSGPKEAAKPEHVAVGQTFTMSAYHQVSMKFQEFMDLGVLPEMRITAVEKIKTADPRKELWKFAGKLSPKSHLQIAEARNAKQLNGGNVSGRPALET